MVNQTKSIILLSMLVFTGNLFAQLNIGPMGGINMANLNADRETARLWTWGAGAALEYYFSDNIAVRAEPMLLNKGGTIDGTQNNPRIEVEITGIDVPILFKYDLNKPEDAYIIAGPSIGYINTSELGIEISNRIFKADIKELSEKLDIGAVLGVGINIPMPVGVMFLETKYQFGFTNVPKNGTFTAEWNDIEITGDLDEKESKFKTYGIQFMLGYMLQL